MVEKKDLKGDRVVEYDWAKKSICRFKLSNSETKILDVGCGEGNLAFSLAGEGYQVTALDCRRIKKYRNIENPKFVLGDILGIKLDRKFDLITLVSTIEHIGLPGRYSEENLPDGDILAMYRLRRMLKEQGRLVLTLPIGLDTVVGSWHRVYGQERLPKLLKEWEIEQEEYWQKDSQNVWKKTNKESALKEKPTDVPTCYALGLMVLK